MDQPDRPSSTDSTDSEADTSTLTQEEKPAEESSQEKAPPEAPPAPPPSTGQTGGEEPPDDGDGELGARMTFLEHLDELRKRILHAAAAVAIGFVVCWMISEQIFAILAVPIVGVLEEGTMKGLVFTRPTEPFSIWLNVSFVASIFLVSPYLMVQVWLFIAPGLYRNEKAYAVPFLLSSTTLFVLGGIFAYYIILPTALEFLINQFGAPFTPMVTAIEYFNFEIIILIGMGLVFQMPVLVAFLSMFGMVTPGFLWRNFRYAFLLIVIVAAVISPTADVLNLFLWSGPMVALYMISIGISWIFKKRRERKGL